MKGRTMSDHRHERRRPIEVGISLFPGTIPHAGLTPSWASTLAVARRAEELGFDAVMVADHLLMDFGLPERLGMTESLSLLAALAATTSRVRLAPIVASTAYRNPAMLANMAATIDEISGGRFTLGLGAGWHEPEFDAYGHPFDHRVDRFEEALQIILPLLRGECVTFHGLYHDAERCELPVWGSRRGSPPIMIGAKGPRMMRLAARHADIWDADRPADCADPASLRPAIAAIDAACREVGRDPTTLKRTAWIQASMPGHSQPEDHPLAAITSTWGQVTGTPEELADLLRGYAAEGFDGIQVWLDPSTPEGVEEFAKVLVILDRG
jgi:alkanesulfonate monooxygenase SsuD/methylene tetrahydromethanopterin reductase-like flavin-dependent oxidoreductase (luciferase family)